jgi:hypothetical protein
MRAREHRGNLAESLATVFNFETKEDLLKEINERMATHFGPDDVGFLPQGFDDRCGWDTYLVSIRGYGPFGYTDGVPQS